MHLLNTPYTSLRVLYCVLLLSGLVACGGDQSNTSTTAIDFSDPAADATYGVEEIPYRDLISCSPTLDRLIIRTPNYDGLYLVEEEIMDEHQLADYVVEYVLNPSLLPHYANSPKRAYILLIDWREGETAWRACTIEVIRSAYYLIWNEAAINCYGREYAQLPRWHKACVLKDFPLMIDAAGPWIIPPPPPPPPPLDWVE